MFVTRSFGTVICFAYAELCVSPPMPVREASTTISLTKSEQGKMATPFHWDANSRNHLRSAFIKLLRFMKGHLVHQGDVPQTDLLDECNFAMLSSLPNRDCSDLRVTDRLRRTLLILSMICLILSFGMESVPAMESTFMPSHLIAVLGGCNLSRASGKPSSARNYLTMLYFFVAMS